MSAGDKFARLYDHERELELKRAAAPDMFEALVTARIALIAIADSAVEAGFDRLGDIIDEQLGKANAAIAKARGERA